MDKLEQWIDKEIEKIRFDENRIMTMEEYMLKLEELSNNFTFLT